MDDTYYDQQYHFYSPGFETEGENVLLKYLKLKLINRYQCEQTLYQCEYQLRKNEICLEPYSGQFEEVTIFIISN